MLNQKELYKFLYELNTIPSQKLDVLFEFSKNNQTPLEDVLFNEAVLSEEEILKIKSFLSGVPKINLKDKAIKQNSLMKIPEPISREFGIVCFSENENENHLACFSLDTIKNASDFLPKDKKNIFHLDSPSSINKTISRYQNILKDEIGFKISNLSKKSKKISDFGTQEFMEFFPENYLDEVSEDIYTNRLLSLIIGNAILRKADSLNINGDDLKTSISYRINNKNIHSLNLSGDLILPISLSIKKLSDIKLDSKNDIENGYFTQKINGENIFCIFNMIKTMSGYRIHINISQKDVDLEENIEKHIFSTNQIELFYKNISKEGGLVILSGAGNVEKRSTYYNILKNIHKKGNEVISIERPVFQKIPSISQLSIPSKDNGSRQIDAAIIQGFDSIGISFWEKENATKLLNQSVIGRKIITVFEKDFLKMFVDIKKYPIPQYMLPQKASLLISHKEFNTYSELEKCKLSKIEIKHLHSVFSKEELMLLLKEGGYVSKKTNKISDVIFYEKSKKSKKSKTLVKAVLDLDNNMSFAKENIQNVNSKIKKAILENMIILSVKGIIDKKTLIDFIKS